MEKLKLIIEQYGRWAALSIYVERIEAHIETDFSHCLENAKALLEAIGKEICLQKQITLTANISINAVLKNAFSALGYSNTHLISQISSSLATIGQQMGDLRNAIGPTAHGKSLAEIQDRNSKVDLLTREFLIDTTVSVASLLIRNFEAESPRAQETDIAEKVDYQEAEDFNEYWDAIFGEFEMGDYSYTASEILFNIDKQAYLNEYGIFKAEPIEDEQTN